MLSRAGSRLDDGEGVDPSASGRPVSQLSVGETRPDRHGRTARAPLRSSWISPSYDGVRLPTLSTTHASQCAAAGDRRPPPDLLAMPKPRGSDYRTRARSACWRLTMMSPDLRGCRTRVEMQAEASALRKDHPVRCFIHRAPLHIDPRNHPRRWRVADFIPGVTKQGATMASSRAPRRSACRR